MFLSPKTVNFWNIAIPNEMIFKFLTEDEVSEVFFIGGKKYSKQTEVYKKRYSIVSSGDKSVSFSFPKDGSLSWNNNNFLGVWKNTQIKGEIINTEMSIEDYFRHSFPSNKIKHTGQEVSEGLGGSFWTEKTIISEKEGKQFQHILCKTTKGDTSYVITITTSENISSRAHFILFNILQTFYWKE